MKLNVSIAFLITAVICCSCSPSSSLPLTTQNLVGTFKGSYGGADEIFTFRSDGTFTQTLSIANNVQYTNDGQWKINANQSAVELRNVYAALDMKGQLKPDKMHNMEGFWVSLNQRSRIVFQIDHNYVIDKLFPPGANETK